MIRFIKVVLFSLFYTSVLAQGFSSQNIVNGNFKINNGVIDLGDFTTEPSTFSNGQMYYNTTTNKYRCKENGVAVNCIGSGGGGGVSGSGTVGTIPLWTGSTTTLGDSLITQAAGTDTVGGNLSVTGNTTIGDAAGDTLTCNAATWSLPNDVSVSLGGDINGLNFDSNTLSIDAANNRIGIGTAAPETDLDIHATVGLTPLVYLSSADVAHSMTSLAPTDVSGSFGEWSSVAFGGSANKGFSVGDQTAYGVEAFVGATSTTAPAQIFRSAKKNGTGSQNLAATEIHTQWQKGDTTSILTLYGDGSLSPVVVNDAASGYALTVSAIAGRNPSQAFTDGNVAHGMTAIAPTNVTAAFSVWGSDSGGLYALGLSDSDASAFGFEGYIGTTTPTQPVQVFRSAKKNGTGSQNLADTEVHTQWQKGDGTALMTLLGGGSLTISTTLEINNATTTTPTCAADTDVGKITRYIKTAGATISICICTKLANAYTKTALGTGDCT
jgi:hypothetical protein